MEYYRKPTPISVHKKRKKNDVPQFVDCFLKFVELLEIELERRPLPTLAFFFSLIFIYLRAKIDRVKYLDLDRNN